MENERSRRQTVGNGLPSSPRLLRTKSKSTIRTTSMPEIHPSPSNSGRKSISRPSIPTRSRLCSSCSSKDGNEENRNPSTTTIIRTRGILKKPQDSLTSSPVRNLQRHRSPDVGKTLEKAKTKRIASVTPSAWALSSGRSLGRSSFKLPVPESSDFSGRTKPKSGSVSGVSNRFRKKKVSTVQEEAFHQLRVMHTRYSQWRFVNARVESTLISRKYVAEEKIFKVWLRICHVRDSIEEKQLQIQELKDLIKINRVINPQVCILNEWEKIEKKNSEAIARMLRKLFALSTVLPLINDAKADTDSFQNAIVQAMGVMDSIEATISKFVSQVEETGSLASDLVNTVEQEKKGLEELRKVIAIAASLEGII